MINMINKIKDLRKQCKEVQLECIDKSGFMNSENKRQYKEDILDGNPLIVSYFNYRDDVVLCEHETIILKDELKFFKIK